ncbi:ribosome biogenesis GTPase Der [Helicobacter labacensis]|uniref:ribosome biogenesis GTPase Der n=1 Tax=Helicobacter labacensis TaxID=2316079 RepID=UPI000EAB7ED7|nr:ribosome biogenesis GTPase Der [Helicobacter labacensis]
MHQIAIVGQPNVGKSSLFNCLSHSQSAITSPIATTTRDIKRQIVDLQGHAVQLLDTGGFDSSHILGTQIHQHNLKALKTSDLVLFVVDGKIPPQEEDKRLVYQIQKHAKACFLLVNKIDNQAEEHQAYTFGCFGIKQMFFVSASHKRGLTPLIAAINATLRPSQETPSLNSTSTIQVGIIGRVNVGKSALLNALVHQERALVSTMPGTTINPVDQSVMHSNQEICFVDTAGLRQRSKIAGLEKYALDRTNKVLAQSHIALLVLDASAPFVDLDEKIAALVEKHRLGVVVALNKWDIRHGEFERVMQDFKRKFKFLHYAPVLTTSALDKRHIHALKDKIVEVYQHFCQRINTSTLNQVIAQATQQHPLPSDHGKIVRIYYSTQFASSPPQIALVMNRPKALHFSYKRYLINTLRARFGFLGTPIFLSTRAKKSTEA